MAARNRPSQNEACREKIQTTQLIKRLQGHVFEEVQISQTQMKAIEILLKKSLPDLSSQAITGADGESLPPAQYIINVNGIEKK